MICSMIVVLGSLTELVKEGLTRSIELESSKFKDVVESAAFVDKTMLIRTWLSHEIVAVTAPRRFGKSTNMDMVKCFCEMPVDASGEPLDPRSTANYRLFSENNLNLYRLERKLFDEHVGAYPVIHLEFECLNGSDYKSFMSSFRDLVKKTYASHKYLLKSLKLDDGRKEEIMKCLGSMELEKMDENDLMFTVKTLSRLLHKHFGRKCVVMIDDFDAAMQNAIIHSGSDTSEIATYIRRLSSSLLQSNSHVQRALINSCIWLSTGLKEKKDLIKRFPFSEQHAFSLFYGFTEEELLDLTKRIEISDTIQTIRSWYGGYSRGNLTFSSNIFNTYSVINYLHTKQLNGYWAQTDYIVNLKRIISMKWIRAFLLKLLDGNTVTMGNLRRIHEAEVVKLSQMVHDLEECGLYGPNPELMLHYMLDMGYLTVANDRSDLSFDHIHFVRIPNKEVKHRLQSYM